MKITNLKMRSSSYVGAALTLVCVLILVACSTNPVTGRKQLMLVSEQQAISASKEAYVEMLAPLAKSGKVDNRPEVTARVKRITSRLIPHAIAYRPETGDWEWAVKVIDEPDTVNAFCMAGGKMAIYTGLIEKLQATDDEIAQVMGHEIAHALSAHTAEKMSIALASDLAVAGVGMAQDNSKLALAGASMAAAVAVKLPNSRQAEEEADRIGIELAAKGGYDPRAAVSLWRKMAHESGSESRFDFFSTHPAPVKRQETLGALADEMMPYFSQKGERPTYQFNDR